jgi:hypothetical protein
MYHGRVTEEKFSRSSVMNKMHQFTIKDSDNIQFLCLINPYSNHKTWLRHKWKYVISGVIKNQGTEAYRRHY